MTDRERTSLTDMSDNVFAVKLFLSVDERMPKEFAVFPARPNPFNPGTAIAFALPHAERVAVDIFNLSGQKVGCAFAGNLEPGRHPVTRNAGTFSAGVYFACIRAGGEVKTVKMLLVK